MTNKTTYDYSLINGMNRKKLIQIGACDGVMADNVRSSILEHKIESLLIEPITYNFEMLTRNYEQSNFVSTVKCAIDSFEEEREMNYFTKVAGKDHMIGVASFYDTEWTQQASENLRFERVKCRTLESVITEFSMQDANIFQIDTEGHDYHIVKQINFSRHATDEFFLVSEHFWDKFTSDFEKEKESMVEELLDLGCHVETTYGRRSGNKTGLQVTRGLRHV